MTQQLLAGWRVLMLALGLCGVVSASAAEPDTVPDYGTNGAPAAGPSPEEAPVLPLTPTQAAIFETVLQADGFITEDLHAAFWAEIPEEMRSDPAGFIWLLAELEASVTVGLRFQRETWRSAQLSLRAGTVVTTPTFEGARTDAEALIRATRDESDARGMRLANALGAADALLAAAASGGDLRVGGAITPLTEDRITSVLSDLDASLTRADRLLASTWEDDAFDQVFTAPGVALTWPAPFTMDIRRREGRSGTSLATWSLTARSDLRAFAFVTVIDLSGPWRNAETGLTRLARQALSSAGIDAHSVETDPWQGRVSTLGMGERPIKQPADDKEQPEAPEGAVVPELAPAAFAAVRVIDVPERRRVVTLMALSATSQTHARDQLDALSGSLRLLPTP